MPRRNALRHVEPTVGLERGTDDVCAVIVVQELRAAHDFLRFAEALGLQNSKRFIAHPKDVVEDINGCVCSC